MVYLKIIITLISFSLTIADSKPREVFEIPLNPITCGSDSQCKITEYCENSATPKCTPCSSICRDITDMTECQHFCPGSFWFMEKMSQRNGENLLQEFFKLKKNYDPYAKNVGETTTKNIITDYDDYDLKNKKLIIGITIISSLLFIAIVIVIVLRYWYYIKNQSYIRQLNLQNNRQVLSENKSKVNKQKTELNNGNITNSNSSYLPSSPQNYASLQISNQEENLPLISSPDEDSGFNTIKINTSNINTDIFSTETSLKNIAPSVYPNLENHSNGNKQSGTIASIGKPIKHFTDLKTSLSKNDLNSQQESVC